MKIDLPENDLIKNDPGVLEILLQDRSSGRNIIWATESYHELGAGYAPKDEIKIELISGAHGKVIQPRVSKSKAAQASRVRAHAEVFTPLWVVNSQNNLMDADWFGRYEVFNRWHHGKKLPNGRPFTWQQPRPQTLTPAGHIKFPPGKTWQDYVRLNRLEITCGEAPYLASRYDPVTGAPLAALHHRVGFLDRKLRIVTENTRTPKDWIRWALVAAQSLYGFDWQGDNVLLARENLYCAVRDDYFPAAYPGHTPPLDFLQELADILSWNIWQMDGLKFVVPLSCHETCVAMMPGFEDNAKTEPCPGCAKDDPSRHNGIPCRVKNWQTGKTVLFKNLVPKGVWS